MVFNYKLRADLYSTFQKNNAIIAAVTFISVHILIRVYKGRGEPIRAILLVSEECKYISQFISSNQYELTTNFLRFDITSTRQNRKS